MGGGNVFCKRAYLARGDLWPLFGVHLLSMHPRISYFLAHFVCRDATESREFLVLGRLVVHFVTLSKSWGASDQVCISTNREILLLFYLELAENSTALMKTE